MYKNYFELQDEKEKMLEDEIMSKTIPKHMYIKVINYRPNIYKYYSPDVHNLASIYDGNMWMSSPDYFNDPYDCAINAWKADKYILSKEDNDILKNASNIIDNIIGSIKKKFFITCYSEIPDSILMWSHYAKNHTGFCVEYNIDDIERLTSLRDDDYKKFFAPVIYKDKELLTKSKDIYESDYKIICLSFIKAKDWIYEQEWRQLYVSKNEVPDEKKGLLVQSPPIKNIIVGCQTDKFIHKILRNICQEKGYGFDEMIMENNSFHLERKKIL